jgi:hypothetical protein
MDQILTFENQSTNRISISLYKKGEMFMKVSVKPGDIGGINRMRADEIILSNSSENIATFIFQQGDDRDVHSQTIVYRKERDRFVITDR